MTGSDGCGRLVGFLHCPATARITLSDVDCFRALWNETVLQALSLLYASIVVCVLYKNEIPSMLFEAMLYFVSGIA